MPVLLLHDAQTHPFDLDRVSSLIARFPNTQVRELPGTGLLGPQLHGAGGTSELGSFFAAATTANSGWASHTGAGARSSQASRSRMRCRNP